MECQAAATNCWPNPISSNLNLIAGGSCAEVKKLIITKLNKVQVPNIIPYLVTSIQLNNKNGLLIVMEFIIK